MRLRTLSSSSLLRLSGACRVVKYTPQKLLSPCKQVSSSPCHYRLTSFSSVVMEVTQVTELEGGQPTSTTNGEEGKPLSKKVLKRIARAQKYKELKQKKKAENLMKAQRDDAGYKIEDFDQSTYYFENGLRKVYPYHFVFATHAKGRWVGRTIEDVLRKEFGFDQPGDLTKAFDTGQIHVNNVRVGPDYKIRDCDYISHRTHRHENPVTWAPLEIIKDTEDLVVINKPSSIPCHPCGRYRFNSVVFILGKELGYTNLRNIYRLDRLTSGVLILAKTMQMTKTLEDQVRDRQVQKEYVCRVVGKFPDDPVTVDQPLRPLSNKLRLQVVCPTGKASQTEFQLLSYNGKSSVVRCRPYTGRTHQIRVHLQYLGHPIINDAFYNNPAWGPSGGKGGNYEVPFEQVCERILKEHHANLWDGGDNPLYFEKLKELQERQAKVTPVVETCSLSQEKSIKPGSALEIVDSTNMSGCGLEESEITTASEAKLEKPESNGNSEGAPCAADSSAETRNSAGLPYVMNSPVDKVRPSPDTSCNAGDTETSGDEPPIKRRREDPGGEGEESSADLKDPSSSLAAFDDSHLLPKSTAGSLCVQEKKFTTDTLDSESNHRGEEDGSLSPNRAELEESKMAGQSDSQPAGTCQGQSLLPSPTDSRPGFEEAKWSLDVQCELCKRLPIEPKEKDLVMFLHALKYKGPGWEFETELPKWAEPDWSREEDYMN